MILHPEANAGKISIFTVLASTTVIAIAIGFFEVQVPHASADDVSTSVTVLNTPPQWVEDAQETPSSSTTSPTNIGATLTFTGRASDSNNESYYLLICKTESLPTANSSAAPSCNGGVANQWAVSSLTASNATATAATTTTETWVFENEGYAWYGWVCDANASLPRCNTAYRQGPYPYESPFVINHRPYFTNISNDGPEDPGGTVTWTSTSFDNDATVTPDTVQLIVCKANDFNGSSCGAGGTWATSTLVVSNAATTTPIVIPSQDKSYDAYVFLKDVHGLVASTSFHGFNSSFSVNNVAPTITASTITLADATSTSNPAPGGDLNLWNPVATSGPYFVTFTAADNNSCLANGGGAEISFGMVSVFRSGVELNGCNDSGDFNTNHCYAASSSLFLDRGYGGGMDRGMFCRATTTGAGACQGATDDSVDWECWLPLWYNADPTDGSVASDTPWVSEHWRAAAQVNDNNAASSTYTNSSIASTSQPDLARFLSFDVSSTSIEFPGLEPGQAVTNLGEGGTSTTDIIVRGNTGLDQNIYGSTMCTNFLALGGATNPDACDTDGINTAQDIPATTTHKIGTSSTAYSGAEAYLIGPSTTPLTFRLKAPKTTSTSSPTTRYNYWGIAIPSAITLAGDYTGENTIIGIQSHASDW